MKKKQGPISLSEYKDIKVEPWEAEVLDAITAGALSHIPKPGEEDQLDALIKSIKRKYQIEED